MGFWLVFNELIWFFSKRKWILFWRQNSLILIDNLMSLISVSTTQSYLIRVEMNTSLLTFRSHLFDLTYGLSWWSWSSEASALVICLVTWFELIKNWVLMSLFWQILLSKIVIEPTPANTIFFAVKYDYLNFILAIYFYYLPISIPRPPSPISKMLAFDSLSIAWLPIT